MAGLVVPIVRSPFIHSRSPVPHRSPDARSLFARHSFVGPIRRSFAIRWALSLFAPTDLPASSYSQGRRWGLGWPFIILVGHG
jgi:hypothetical protein